MSGKLSSTNSLQSLVWEPKVLLVYCNLPLMQILPAGISSLAAYLKSKGVTVELFDTTMYKCGDKSPDEERIDNCQVRPFKFSESGVEYKNTDMIADFREKVIKFKPQVVAISSNDFTHIVGEKLINNFKEDIRNIDKDMYIPKVISGGMYPTFFPDHAISHPEVDAICIGEGYEALTEYVDMVCNPMIYGNKSLYNIKNLWVKERSSLGDVIHKNDLRKPIDINTLPFDDFSLFDEKRFYRPMQGKMLKMIPQFIDIGCPYNCTYCVAPTLRNMYKDCGHVYNRIKTVSHIMDELHYQVEKYSPNYLYISTENFFSRPKDHILEFAERYSNEIKLPFWCESRVETITEDNVKLLKKMGCDRISMGLEAGDEYYRMNFLKKNFTNEQFYDALGILNKHRLNCTINNIIGLPEQNRADIFQTIHMNKLAYKTFNDIDITLTVSTFVPCGGSGLQKYCIDNGYFNVEEYLKRESGSFHKGVYLDQPSISGEELVGLLRTFPLYVRFDWTYDNLYNISKAERFTDEGNEKFSKLRDIYWNVLVPKLNN